MSKTYLSVPNWDHMQHYKDRAPPWIKLHNHLLESYKFESLDDACKGHLICIWLLASRTNNKIINDERWISRKIGAKSKIDLQTLIKKEFLQVNQCDSKMGQDASMMQHDLQVSDHQEREERRAEERREEQNTREKNIKKAKGKVTRDLFKSFWTAYPEDLRGGNITTSWNAWKKNSAKQPNLYNDESLLDATEWVKKSTEWKYVEGISKFIKNALWKRSIKNAQNETCKPMSNWDKIEQAERTKNEQEAEDYFVIGGHCELVENDGSILPKLD